MSKWGRLLAGMQSDEATCVEVLEHILRYIDSQKSIFEKIHQQEIEPDEFNELSKILQESLYYSASSSGLSEPGNHIERSNGPGILNALSIAGDSWKRRKSIKSPLREVVLAYAAALVLDDVYSSEWIDAFRETYDSVEFEVEPGRIFPIASPFNRFLMLNRHGRMSRLSPGPDRRNTNHRVLSNVALRANGDFEILIDTRLYGSIHDRKSQELRILATALAAAEAASEKKSKKGEAISESTISKLLEEVGLPNSSETWNEHWPRMATAILNQWDELEWSIKPKNGHNLLKNVHPGKARKENSYIAHNGSDDWEIIQEERIFEVLQLASKEQVDVLVFPELCFTEKIQENVISHIKKSKEHVPSLIVLGSVHIVEGEDENATQENISKTLVYTESGVSSIVAHRKFNPLTGFHAELPEGEKVIADEYLKPVRKRITLCVGPSSSFCQLICKDFLHTEIGSLWSSLRPKLILVPALSTVHGPFKDAATTAVSHGYCISVVADNGIRHDDLSPGNTNKRRFATFGILGCNESGAAGTLHEDAFKDKMPQLPRLLLLRWASEMVKDDQKNEDERRSAVEVVPKL